MARRLRRRPRQMRSTKARFGPFIGMRDSLDPPANHPNLARVLRNVYPAQVGHHARVVGRPGFEQLGTQLGSSGRRTGQLICQFTELDGTEHTIAIVGGHFYEYDWIGGSWTEVLDAADFSGASITLSQTARCYAVTFNNQLIVSDGVNTPWAWDGTSGGGLTSLTNCPVLFGPPTVYYGKLFGIKSSERSTFVWSEENQPNTGYEAGGYNNAWTIGQTDTNQLTCLLGSNEALYVFRERSTTLVTGAVTPNFASTGTREGVSSTVGTAAPGSVHFVDRDIIFADADGRPHLIRHGLGVIPLWEDFKETLNGLDSAVFDEVEGFWDPTLEMSRLGYGVDGGTDRGRQLLFEAERGQEPQAVAVFDGFEFDRIGVVENSDGEPRILHTQGGYAYQHGTPEGAIWNDGLNAGDQAILHQIAAPYLGYDEEVEQHWDRLDLLMFTRTDLSNLAIRTETPYGVSSAITSSETGDYARWDEAFWDIANWSTDSQNDHVAIGIDAFGLYIGILMLHEELDEEFGFVTGKLTGRPLGYNPETP